MINLKILLVEDEKDLNRSITKLLKKNNFSVDSAFDGQEALDYLDYSEYDVIILDIMMPNMNGYTFIERMRKRNFTIPVLMLTAKDSLEDKIKGLDLGADDYLVKPFEFQELLARIRALLRRLNRSHTTNVVTIQHITIDFSTKSVFKKQEIVDLTAKEYEVFEYLVRNVNHIKDKEQIRQHVWDFDYEGESNIIEVIIKNIRRKLDLENKPSIIQTKRGVGYVIRTK